MTDPVRTQTITINGRTLSLRFNFRALRIINKRLPNRPLHKLLQEMDFDIVCEFAGAAAHVTDDSVTSDVIDKLLDEDPKKFLDLMKLVSTGVSEAYARMSPPGEGAAGAPTTTATPAQETTHTEAGPTSDG